MSSFNDRLGRVGASTSSSPSFGSTVFVTATMSLVVAPIARLTELLTEMAGVIGLGGASTVDKLIDEALCARHG